MGGPLLLFLTPHPFQKGVTVRIGRKCVSRVVVIDRVGGRFLDIVRQVEVFS